MMARDQSTMRALCRLNCLDQPFYIALLMFVENAGVLKAVHQLTVDIRLSDYCGPAPLIYWAAPPL
jgi:hypothetical protein